MAFVIEPLIGLVHVILVPVILVPVILVPVIFELVIPVAPVIFWAVTFVLVTFVPEILVEKSVFVIVLYCNAVVELFVSEYKFWPVVPDVALHKTG